MMKNSITPILILILLGSQLRAQTAFVNSNAMLQQKDEHSAVPVGIADMNGDGLDDIVTLDF